MRGSKVTVLIAFFLLICAAIPWFMIGCTSVSLMPDALRDAREHYEATAEAYRSELMEKQRQAPSSITLILPTPTPDYSIEAPTDQPVSYPMSVSTPMPATGSTPIISLTTSSRIVVIQSSFLDVKLPHPSPEVTNTLDIITQDMLTAQIRKDFSDVSIHDLTITINQAGISAIGAVPLYKSMMSSLRISGTFEIANHSLVINIASIYFGDRDVTRVYREQLEDQLTWSLYQLLPQRYVKDYKILDNQVFVYSWLR